MKEIEKDNIIKLFNDPCDEDFSTYTKPYLFTNEMIKSSLTGTNITNTNRALSIMASGDHPLNLACIGFKKIDTIDSNAFCEDYFYGIKKPAIGKYSYKEFIEFFKELTSEDYKSNNIIKDVLDNQYRDEWLMILNHANEQKTPIGRLFRRGPSNFHVPNLYLENEENYEKTKENLKRTTITFKNLNVKDLTKLKGKYDLIHLSNVLEYRNLIYPKHRYAPYNYEIVNVPALKRLFSFRQKSFIHIQSQTLFSFKRQKNQS